MRNQLTERHQNTCIYGGVFGVMLSATCLIQLMAYTTSHWITYSLLAIYSFVLFSFLLLSLQKVFAPVLIIISTALAMISVAFVMINGFYSLVLLLQFLYGLAFTIVIYMENIPPLLKNKARLQKEEELTWKGKL